jgi:eukaryotic-like serine/threonine-protein kinase
MVRPDSDALHEATTTGPGQAWLPGYRDFVLIARSKASEVYRAHQEGVGRPVAVKVLLLDDEETVARFQRELDITVQLGRQHPHIVSVIDTGVTRGGRPCIVMELYDNGSLHDQLKAHGPLPGSEVLAAGIAVADALAFAHRHGVLHRDVKPQNVLVLPTSYVLADFGIARRVDAAHTASVGWFSFRHAAPQVLDGEPPSVADDLWSLGSTLHTLLDGRSPFASDDAEEDSALAYMRRVRTSRPRPLRRPDVPLGMVAVIERCLRYDPADRFPDADALLTALNNLAAERSARAPAALAASALAHLPGRVAGPVGAGEPPTGRGPEIADVSTSTPDAPPAKRRQGRVLVTSMLGVLVAGLLAVGGAFLTGTVHRDSNEDGVRTPTTEAVTPPGNPRIAPTVTQVRVNGADAVIRWQDPTAGEATFVVVRVVGGQSGAVGTATPGATRFLVADLDPAEPPYCFLVIAVVGEQRAVSPARCADTQ